MKLIVFLFFAVVNANVISVDEFKKCVSVFGHGVPSDAIAQAFINDAGRLGDIWSKREAFIAIAQLAWESAGFTATSELACSNGRWEWYCNSYDRNGCPANRNYFGRGYIQLSHCYNYKACNEGLKQQGMWGDIVNNPDIVATD